MEPSGTSTRNWLWPFIRPIMPIFHEVMAMSFVINMLALAVPIFVMQVYNRVVYHAGLSTLYGLVIGVALVLVFDFVLRQSRSRIMQTVALRVDVQVGRNLYDRMMALPLQALETMPAAHWQSLFRDVDVVRNTLSGASAILMVDLPFVVLFLGLIWIIAQPIFIVLIVIVPLFMLVAWRSAKVMAGANREERQTTQSRDGMIAEMISGRTTIKALALDKAMRPQWEEKHADNIENAVFRGGKSDTYSNLGATLTMVTTVAMTSVGAIEIIAGALTIGALIASNMLSGRILGPLNQLVGQWRTYSSFRQSVERLGQVFNAEGERQQSDVKLDKPRGELRIENVTYGYGPKLAPVLDQISITIPHGGVHAMVGRNGSGKTTLLKIIQGLYRPHVGRVLLDGADIAQFSRSEMADWIGYVPQESVLFAGSVRDNIVHRHPDANDEEIVAAATAAGVHHFIIDLPDGYGTEIGEAGRRLSGGQRQRIAIARALVGDPPILLLDEPSSSLDRQAELELRKTLQEIGQERTVIVVTHSPILLAACEHLVALDRGKVALAGPAKEILPRLFGTPARPPGLTPSAQAAGPHAEQPAPAMAVMQAVATGGPRPVAATPNPVPAAPTGAERAVAAAPSQERVQAERPAAAAPRVGAGRAASPGGPGLRSTMASSGVVSLEQPLSTGLVKLQAPLPGKPPASAPIDPAPAAADRIAEPNA